MTLESKTLFEKLVLDYPETSKQSIRKWLKHGRVLVNDRVAKKGDIPLRSQDEVSLAKKRSLDLPFDILYTDSDIVVVQKPANFLSVASLDPLEPSIHGCLKKALNSELITPLHRLDKEVSGPLIFVKNQKKFDLFKNLFLERKIKREYRAIVHGRMEKKSGTIDSYLKQGGAYKMYSSDDPQKGKRAITYYEVLDQNEEYTFLKITLETGRKNQIRVHLSSFGHPIVGDDKYGQQIDRKKAIALYAHSLNFIHPITGKEMTFDGEVPPIFKHLLKKAKLFCAD